MDMDSDERVDLACRGFRKAVQAWCRRYTHLPQHLNDNGNANITPSLPHDIDHLLNHASHLVRQLAQKRKSLQSGLSYLQTTLWPLILAGFSKVSNNNRSSSSSSDRQVALLQHFLVQCLRLHDGLLLLVSGECRHPGDIQMAKTKKNKKLQQNKNKSNYPSQLHLQTHRPDGYTKLYTAPGGYSGYGWDEFHDPELGIQTRLFAALERYSKTKKRKTKTHISEYLVEHGGQALESLLDHHESEMKLVQMGFTTLRDRVVQGLKRNFSQTKNAASQKQSKVVFTLHDKMEKLQVGNIVLERHGDAFQVCDPQGALPNGYTAQHWSRVMALPQSAAVKEANVTSPTGQGRKSAPTSKASNSNSVKPSDGANVSKKRRRVILEDSSDEEDIPVVAPPTRKKASEPAKSDDNPKAASAPLTPVVKSSCSGLHVKVKKMSKSPTPGEGTSLSLATIKTQMGADVEALEAAREVVEREEAGASKAAKAEEVEAMATSIAEGEANIRSQRRVLKRVLLRKDPNADEMWDARELLREQLMAVGNQLLWEPTESESAPEVDRKEFLLVALTHFQEAKELVKEQEGFRRRTLNTQVKYKPAELRFFSRNLLLLEGQAHTNLGITNIELATETKRKTKYRTVESKRFLREAVEDLSMAKQFAEAFRSRSTRDRERGSNDIGTMVDSVRADQLASLALRWWGTALWRQGLRMEAAEKFESGALFFVASSHTSVENVLREKGVHEAVCQLGADCFYACTALADLASSDMEELPPAGAVREGDDLLAVVTQILTRASVVCEAVRTFIEANPVDDFTFDEYIEENEIMSSQAVRQYLAEIEEWWKRRKSFANKPIVVGDLVPERRNFPLRRSEVEALGLEKLPTRIFTVTEGGSRRKKKRNGPSPSYHKHSGELLSAVPRVTESSNNGRSGEIPPKRYRPWGDELLPQTIDEVTGRSIPKIGYPSIAPLMPPDIRALLEA